MRIHALGKYCAVRQCLPYASGITQSISLKSITCQSEDSLSLSYASWLSDGRDVEQETDEEDLFDEVVLGGLAVDC